MSRILAAVFLCAGTFLGTSALAGNNCLTDSTDPAVSFPDGSYDYIFSVNSDSKGGYSACFYSPTVLNMSAFSQDSIADFNKDGWADLVLGVRSSGGGEMEVFLNDGTGSGIVVSNAIFPTGASVAPNIVGTPDLDGDGWPDILTSNGSDGTVSVILNDGTGGFPSVKQYAAGSDITSMAAMDLDGDGLPDIVTNDTANKAVDVLMNEGTGDLKTAVAYPVGSTPTYMQVGDLDGDGYPDIVTGSGQTVSVLTNKGDGSFAPVTTYYTSLLMYVGLMDVNHDGKLDIVVAANYQASYAVYAMVNNGDGTFAAPNWFVLGATTGGSSGANIGITSGGYTLIGGSSLPLSGGNSYSSGSGNIQLPTAGVQSPVSSSGSTSSGNGSAGNGSGSTSSGSGSTSNGSGSTSGGGGALGLLDIFGLMYFAARRKRR